MLPTKNSPPSQRPCKLASMTIADDIEALVKRKRRLSLNEEDIATGHWRTQRSLHVPSPIDQTTS